MEFTKDYKFGQCVVAANEFNDANGGNYRFYVVRCLKTSNPNQTTCVPIAYFKEKDASGTALNSHCFLLGHDQQIVDPLFKKREQTLFAYMKYLVEEQLDLSAEDPKYVILDVQELDEEHRKNNRSQFMTSYPCFGVLYDRTTTECQLLDQ